MNTTRTSLPLIALRFHLQACAVVTALFIAVIPSHATDYIWDGSASTAWTTPANWDLNSNYPGFAAEDNVIGNTATTTAAIASNITINNLTPTLTGWTITVNPGNAFTVGGTASISGLALTLRGDGAASINMLNVASSATVNGVFQTTSGGTSGVRLSVGSGGTNISSVSGRNSLVNLGPLAATTYAGGGSNLGVVNFSGAAGIRTLNLLYNTSGSADYTQTVQAQGLSDAVGIAGTTTINGGFGNSAGSNVLTATLNLNVSGTYSTGAILADGAQRGTLAVVKNGVGTQTLLGTSTYTQGTTINLGTLVVGNASGLGTGAVTVSGGTLRTSVANLNVGGALAVSSGALDLGSTGVGSLTLASDKNFVMTGGTYNLDIASPASFDTIFGSGTGTFSISDATFDLTGSTLVAGTYNVLSGFASGSVTNLGFTGIEGYTASLGADGVLTVGAVPEPSSALLLTCSGTLAGLIWFRRRSRISR